jgi:integrase
VKLIVKDLAASAVLFFRLQDMSSTNSKPPLHTGRTDGGNTRDVKIERVGKVTIYKRGSTYCLYYREDGRSVRRAIEGNLAVARATAAKIVAALAEQRPSPLGFQRTSPEKLVADYLDFVENVQGLAWRTVDRYRAALDRFKEFCLQHEITAVDAFQERTVEDFVRWMRGLTRARNGMKTGKHKDHYKTGGIKFILSTCRTLFNWAARRRMLPPYAENAFGRFPIDQLRDPAADEEEIRVFTPKQEQAFFDACSNWQKAIFVPLATYGMRVGEWTHLLIENLDFEEGTIHICSKPEMFWRVKTARRRKLPLTAEMSVLLKKLIGRRRSGFVLLNEVHFGGRAKPAATFATDREFRAHLESIVKGLEATNPKASKRDKRRAVTSFCRAIGQIPVKRVQSEFCKLTEAIGCSDFTRAHDLRHLFATRAQERGTNPLIVQQLTGHRSLDMLKRYTHPSMAATRQAMELISQNHSATDTSVQHEQPSKTKAR